MHNKCHLVLLCLTLLLPVAANAQKFAVSTNVVDYVCLGTLNLEGSAAVAQHFTVTAGMRYNPWDFESHDPDMQVYNHMTSFSAGVRYWPWYVYSGWWASLKGQYEEYGRTGIWRPALEEGKALGCVLSAGYSLMIGNHCNIELGVGGWAGKLTDYTLYCCPNCMDIRDEGPRGFVRSDDIYLSVSYIF